MASTAVGATLTILHRQRQLALRSSLISEIARLFPGWKLNDESSYEMLQAGLIYLVNQGSQKSAELAASYYQLFRQVEAPGAEALPKVVLSAAPPIEQIRTALRVTSKGAAYRSLGAGMDYPQAMANALVQVSGSMSRIALDSGRDTIMDNVRSDPRAVGWAREGSGEECAFCAMLISRGPVYKEETVDFEAHDHCVCFGTPVYDMAAGWSDQAREYSDMWSQTGDLNGFRSALTERAAATAA